MKTSVKLDGSDEFPDEAFAVAVGPATLEAAAVAAMGRDWQFKADFDPEDPENCSRMDVREGECYFAWVCEGPQIDEALHVLGTVDGLRVVRREEIQRYSLKLAPTH